MHFWSHPDFGPSFSADDSGCWAPDRHLISGWDWQQEHGGGGRKRAGRGQALRARLRKADRFDTAAGSSSTPGGRRIPEVGAMQHRQCGLQPFQHCALNTPMQSVARLSGKARACAAEPGWIKPSTEVSISFLASSINSQNYAQHASASVDRYPRWLAAQPAPPSAAPDLV